MIKSLLPDEFTIPSSIGDTAQDEAELKAWIDTDEAQLASFSTERLIAEVYARTTRELDHLTEVTDHLRSLVEPMAERPF